MRYFSSFSSALRSIREDMKTASALVPSGYWQSMDMSAKPEMATYEMMNVGFSVCVTDHTREKLVEDIGPSLPWAEDHFKERVGGEPLNPGDTWRSWPYSLKADSFRDASGKFNHNYMERYWPRYAGIVEPDGRLHDNMEDSPFNVGIRAPYGDLWDVIDLFIRDPLTRQAYIPIFFPEDTGSAHGGRVPCTLGYHVIRRNDRLHINYYIRSCDMVRHLADDIYLTVRLLQWILDQLKIRDPENWLDVLIGNFTMFITSLHMFRNDWQFVYGEQAPNYIGGINEYSRGYRRGQTAGRAPGGSGGVKQIPSGGGASTIVYPTAGGGGGCSAVISRGDGGSIFPASNGVGGQTQVGLGGGSSGSGGGASEASSPDKFEGGASPGSSG